MTQRTFLRIFVCSVVITGILSMGVLYHSAIATQSVDQLKESIDRIQKILQNESLAQEDIKAQVSEQIERLFDFHEMAKLTLGKYWDLNASKRDEFVLAFSGFIKRLSFRHLDKLKSAQVHVLSESWGINRSQIEIELQGSETYRLDIKMHQAGGRWMIYDVNVGGISIAQNFRAQFARKLKQKSMDDLIQEIHEKNK